MNKKFDFNKAASRIAKETTENLIKRRDMGDKSADTAIKLLSETPRQKILREALATMSMSAGWNLLKEIIENFEKPELGKLISLDTHRKVFIEWDNREFMFEFHQLQEVMRTALNAGLAKHHGQGILFVAKFVAVQTQEQLGRNGYNIPAELVDIALFEVSKAFVEHMYSE